jgi:hypothetical protein
MRYIKIPENIERNWILNEKAPLNSQYCWGNIKGIISLIYCPETKEFNLGMAERHKSLAQGFSTSLSKFVRGIYLKKEGRVILRAYAVDKIENFNAQYDTVEALNLESYKVKFNASKEELYYQHGWT